MSKSCTRLFDVSKLRNGTYIYKRSLQTAKLAKEQTEVCINIYIFTFLYDNLALIKKIIHF